MGKTNRIRTKPCARRGPAASALYRVRVELDGPWIFVCEACLDAVKPDNPHYRYGGTWKAKKRS